MDDSTTLEQLTAAVERRVRWNGKPFRALHPFDLEDHALVKAVNRGEFAIQRQRPSAVSRNLPLLRVHGLIRKLPHTKCYKVSENGRLILHAILSAHRVTVQHSLR